MSTRRTTVIQTLTAQGAATVAGSAFEVVELGNLNGVVFVVVGDETAGGGGDLTVTIQDSQDGVVWGTLVALGAIGSDGESAGVPTRAPLKFVRASSEVAVGGDTWSAVISAVGDIGFAT